MARKKKKKKVLVKLELGLGGLLGLAIVTFCIFLWMFLFGVWTGQTVLQPVLAQEKALSLASKATRFWQGNGAGLGQDSNPAAVGQGDRNGGVADQGDSEKKSSFFAIQVSAFRDQERAQKAVLQWRARDYQSFYLLPEQPDGTFNRVFVGHFESLAEANLLAAKLESGEHDKDFITLITEDQKQYP